MPAEFDYIVIGSGAGGGPLACNLALAPEGFRVALLEAGPDPVAVADTPAAHNYSVPAFHTFASEDPGFGWGYSVRHYTDDDRQKKDSKYCPTQDGIFYPRAGALGGCTAVHAMITMYPHHDDWERLRALTGDPSWSAQNMRGYFERLEECRYLARPHLRTTTDPSTRHGVAGWLPVSMPDPLLVLGDREGAEDRQMLRILFKAFLAGSLAAETPRTLNTLHEKKRRLREDEENRLVAVVGKVVDRLFEAASRAADRFGSYGPLPDLGLREELVRRISEAGRADDPLAALAELPGLLQLFVLAQRWLDPNRWFDRDADRVGAFSAPASVMHGVRSGVRERVLGVRARYPDRLVLVTGALATKVLLEAGRAVGVHVVRGPNGRPLYRASAGAPGRGELPTGEELRLRPGGEVIVACGAFNSPQLLMLSGIGSGERLKQLGIPVRRDLPGVGKNLQDRYEFGLVSELPADFSALASGRFQLPGPSGTKDPALQEWYNHRGIYTTNGVVLSILLRSSQADDEVPDLCLFGVPGNFRGYYPGYAVDGQSEMKGDTRVPNHRRFTWAVLKARTRNHAGEVSLRTADPRDPPRINFRYLDEGSGEWRKDLEALAEGVTLAARIMADTGLRPRTLVPDFDVSNAVRLREYLANESWGHHASGTCKIGKDDDPLAVLDGDFRVRGVPGLRVVDASVFPDIPGFFIVTPIYMISEKASDVILTDRRAGRPRPWPGPTAGG